MTPVDNPPFLVEDLIPSGVNIIAGDEKTGKSWMMLHLALCVAQGKDFLGHPVHQGTVFYLSLEDSLGRLQNRLFKLIDETAFGKLYFSTKCVSLSEGLIEQLTRIVEKMPDVRLFIIDTLQLVRGNDKDMSYANDYADIAKIKEFADGYGVDIFLVHHVRKQGDSRNIFNRFNGT